jgi:DNA-binding GntR family transcriptional regulator
MISEKKENKAEQAYQKLRQMIFEHRFESGSRLMEPACAKMLHVNRADIRVAMTRLVSEGLLTRGEKIGYFIPRLSRQQKLELYEIRFILESASAQFAVDRATPEDLQHMEKICRDMELMADGGYQMGVVEADLRFHEAMVHAAHNLKLDHLYQMANLPLTFVNNPQIKKEISTLKNDAHQHRMIFEALKMKKANRMVALLRNGMELAKKG